MVFLMICSNIFLHEIWNKLVPEFTKTIGIPLQGCPRGRQNHSKRGPGKVQIGPRGALQRFQKTGRQKDIFPREKIKQIGPIWGPKSNHCDIYNYIFQHVSASLFIFNETINGFMIDFNIIFVFDLDVIGYTVETS